MKLKPGRLHHPINDPTFVARWYAVAGRYLALCRHCGGELQVYSEHEGIWLDGFGDRYCDADETQQHEPLAHSLNWRTMGLPALPRRAEEQRT